MRSLFVSGFAATVLAGTVMAAAPAQARSIEEIKATGKLIIGVRQRPLVYSPERKEFQNRESEIFAEWLGKKIGVSLKLEIVKAASIDQIFSNSKGVVDEKSDYQPPYFEKIDFAPEMLVTTAWRVRNIGHVAVIPTRPSFMCNFKVPKVDFEYIKANDVVLVTEKSSNYHKIIERAKLPNRIVFTVVGNFIKATREIKEKACNILNSDTAIYEAKRSGLYFSGIANDEALYNAWWISRSQPELLKYVKAYWEERVQSPEFKSHFLESFGIGYEEYLSLIRTL